MTRFQWVIYKILRICEVVRPYVRIMRVLVTFVAPIILFILYIIHKSYRTRQVQEFMKKFARDRRIMSLNRISKINMWGSNTTVGILELAQLNDMFWVRLTQVIATVIGY